MDADGWEIVATLLKRTFSIGAEATIICVIVVGEYALVGAGVVMTCGVPAYGIVVGGSPRVVGYAGE